MSHESLPPIDHPAPEVVGYYLLLAATYGEVAEQGGMTAEEAEHQRRLALARIGMGNYDE